MGDAGEFVLAAMRMKVGTPTGDPSRTCQPLLCTRLTVTCGRSQKMFATERMSFLMRLCRSNLAGLLVTFALLAATVASPAATCTTQAELTSRDRDALAGAGQRLSAAIVQQDFSTLQAALLPAVASQWDGIRNVAEQGATLVKGGQIQLRSVYLLDASNATAAADTQFFCSNSNASVVVTITMRALPPGKYSVVLADAVGASAGGQLGFILAWDGSAWKLGGVFARPGILGGHDGVWYWEHARDQVKGGGWASWYLYEMARYLLVPVDFLSSPNLEKLGQEQAQLKSSPADAFPYSLPDGPRTWKIISIRVDPSLLQPDLGVTYESTGVTDPAAVRTEATAMLSALLKAQPGLRENFHGLWAYAVNNGKTTPVMELPMAQIP